MTYEEFKRELFRNLTMQERDCGGQVRFWERNAEPLEDSIPHVMDCLNILGQSGTDSSVEEDYLCARWGSGGVNCWKVRGLYDAYRREGWQRVLPALGPGDTDGHGREEGAYEEYRGQLFLRMKNFVRNREKLEDCVYLRFGDTALVLCTCMPDCFQTPVPVAISRQIAGKWHVSVEEIFANALLNGCALHPPRLFRANDLRLECDFSDGAFMPGETDAGTFFRPGDFEEGVKGYRLTTSTGKDGAVAIFYPGVMERLRGLMEGDYYVGFLGVDEVVIHPVLCKSPDEMKAAIHHVNGVYGEKDMLSDRVYRYWGARRRLLEVP